MEESEDQMVPPDLIDSVFEELRSGRVIRVGDRTALGIGKVSIEALLDGVVQSGSVLLHGSGDVIASGAALRLSPGRMRNGIRREREGFATSLASIAILKALFSNEGVNLRYPMTVSDRSPLQLTIVGWRPSAERPRGYVHLIGPRDRFEQEGSTWQWVTSDPAVQFGGCVEVERADFSHPVTRQPPA